MATASPISDVVLFIIDVLEREYHITDHEKIKAMVYLIAKKKSGNTGLTRTFSKWQIKNDSDLEHVIDVYEMMTRLWPETTMGRDRIRDIWYSFIHSAVQETMSNDVIDLIGSAIMDQGMTDRYDILDHVCSTLENRFNSEEDMDNYLNSVCLGTTKNLLCAIDECIARAS